MRLRLSTRLILSVVLIEAVMLSVLVWNSVRLINSSHAELLERSTKEESRLLAFSLAPGLAANDRAVIEDVLALLKSKHDLVYIAVFDREGQLMSALGSRPSRFKPDKEYADAESDGVFDIEQPIELFGQYLGRLQAGYTIEGIQRLTRKTRQQNTSIAGIELLLSIAVTILLGLFLTKSLRKLEEGARALSRGEHQHRIPIDTRDEIGDVAHAFNQLAEHLGEAQEALQQEHQALLRETHHLNTILNNVDAVVIEMDPGNDHISYVSQEAENLLGYPIDEWLRPGFWRRHIHPEDAEWLEPLLKDSLDSPGSFVVDYRMLHRAGHQIWVRAINTVAVDDQGRLACHSILLDITDQKKSEERIVYLADHDYLTGLFNRRRFQEELERHIGYAKRFQHSGALLFIDLDQFKYVNDTLGHQAGDEYLYNVACALAACLRDTDILGRLGGDEFAVILTKADSEAAEHVASVLVKTLSDLTLELSQRATTVSASIGIVVFPEHGDNASELLAKADAAMYSAKDEGRNRAHLYTLDDKGLVAMHAKLQWEERIRRALDENRLKLYFQPVFELESRTVSHFEVLLRMMGEDGEIILPSAFLDTAERFGLIRDIDHWVLNEGIRIQGESRRRGEPVTLAINLSGRHFGNQEVMDLIEDAIGRHDADASQLIFEVTETAAVENLNQARGFIDALHRLGCRLALDDFGVGFSSFHYLKHLPVDMIKIDGSFVRNLDQDGFDRIFIRAMTELAEGLGIATVAEFVESETVTIALRELGVNMGQGFHLARPEPDHRPWLKTAL
ncbi:MAG TPA: EAL domain-containing protein [Alphaproteobacteria bacterium]|nr:EAL domain-containing protein [Alphaproteobacteria bacterium]